jgi:hypothetical protein
MAQFNDAIAKLTETLDKGLKQQAKQHEGKTKQAMDILKNEYKMKDQAWKLRAIRMLQKNDNMELFISLDAGGLRDKWMEEEMQE